MKPSQCLVLFAPQSAIFWHLMNVDAAGVVGSAAARLSMSSNENSLYHVNVMRFAKRLAIRHTSAMVLDLRCPHDQK